MARLLQTVLDTTDVMRAAEFFRAWLGWTYPREPSPGTDWIVLQGPEGHQLAFQLVDDLPRSTWPAPGVAPQVHLDFLAQDRAALEADRARLVELGAPLLLDRSEDPDEPLYVFADPDGHPFCVFTWPDG